MWALPLAGGESVSFGNPDEVESDLSRDGRSLLLTAVDSNGGTLWMRPVRGGKASLLTDADLGSWSPDGKKLAAANIGNLEILAGNNAHREDFR